MYPASPEAALGKVVRAVVIGYEAASYFPGEVDSLCLSCMFRRRAASIIKADLEADDFLEVFVAGSHRC